MRTLIPRSPKSQRLIILEVLFPTHITDQSYIQQAVFHEAIQEACSFHPVGFAVMRAGQRPTVILYYYTGEVLGRKQKTQSLCSGWDAVSKKWAQAHRKLSVSAITETRVEAKRTRSSTRKASETLASTTLLTFKGPWLSLALSPWVPWVLLNSLIHSGLRHKRKMAEVPPVFSSI